MKYISSRISLIAIYFAFLLQSGCCKKMIDTPIHNSFFLVNPDGIIFRCNPLLQRRFNTAGIMIAIIGDWEPIPPWTTIEFSDGRCVQIKVRLTTVDNAVYNSTILGKVGGMLDVRFDPPVPCHAKIQQVQITADAPIGCTTVFWHDFCAN